MLRCPRCLLSFLLPAAPMAFSLRCFQRLREAADREAARQLASKGAPSTASTAAAASASDSQANGSAGGGASGSGSVPATKPDDMQVDGKVHAELTH